MFICSVEINNTVVCTRMGLARLSQSKSMIQTAWYTEVVRLIDRMSFFKNVV